MMGSLKNLIWAVPIGIACTDVLGSVIRIEGTSMQPSLNPAGSMFQDWVFVDKVSYKTLHRYTRGDVAILWAPDDPHRQLIKRVIALEHNTVWDDVALKAQKIPQGRCWVEGDNQAQSGDSKTMYGPVHLGLLEGRVTCIVFPPWRWQRLGRVVPEGRVMSSSSEGPLESIITRY